MNLTRMREHNWTGMVDAAYLQYKDKLDLPDQDIFNIIFHDKPGIFVTNFLWCPFSKSQSYDVRNHF